MIDIPKEWPWQTKMETKHTVLKNTKNSDKVNVHVQKTLDWNDKMSALV